MNKIFYMLVLMFLSPMAAHAVNVADYILDADIGQFSKSYDGSCSEGSGILVGTDHFKNAHIDDACDIRYYNEALDFGVEVQVTQHAGGDSDKWLLHEVERGFRDTDQMEANADDDSMIREITGNKIYFYGGGVVGYRWLSNNVVVNIQYTNLGEAKPEPLEVVKAYLTKFPSAMTLTDADFKSKAHSSAWTKDEMERRLWLCDKWFEQLGLGKTEQKTALQEAVKNMNVFLDYREKYYGLKAEDEKNILQGYLGANDETNIKAKLQDYKTWWSVNKSTSLIGMITTCPQRLWVQMKHYFHKLYSLMASLPNKLMTMFYET